MILQLAESRSAVTQILPLVEKRVKKRMSGAKLLDKLNRGEAPPEFLTEFPKMGGLSSLSPHESLAEFS